MNTIHVQAQARIGALARDVFSFLSDTGNQCWIADTTLDVLRFDRRDEQGGAIVRVRGRVLGERVGEIRLLGASDGRSIMTLIHGRDGATVFAFWQVAEASADESLVTLRIAAGHLSVKDRALLAAGGRRWLRKQAVHVLGDLDLVMSRHRAGLAGRLRRRAAGRMAQG